jgi:hypothetical protein
VINSLGLVGDKEESKMSRNETWANRGRVVDVLSEEWGSLLQKQPRRRADFKRLKTAQF